jgi:hypothetical protein
MKAATLPALTRLLPLAFRKSREDLPQVAPLKVTKAAIAGRIAMIREIENSASQIVKLPWARIKAKTLVELSQTYSAFSEEIRNLKPPKRISEEALAEYRQNIDEIVKPFDEKAAKLRDQALEIAVASALLPSDLAGLDKIPVIAAPPGNEAPKAPRPPDLTQALIQAIETPFHAKEKESAEAERLYTWWKKSLAGQEWGRVAYFQQALERNSAKESPALSVMHAIFFQATGNSPEAFLELEALQAKLGEKERATVRDLLLAEYSRTLATKKAEKLRGELASPEKDERAPATPVSDGEDSK